jgi:26S proteasome regulatory subunit N8
VEHLLRDIKDLSVGTLSAQVTDQVNALKGLFVHLRDISQYLVKVLNGSLPVNHPILYNLQDMFSLLPNLQQPDTVKAFSVKTNDELVVMYLSSLVRAVIALHHLIDNKMMLRDYERVPAAAKAAEPATTPAAATTASDDDAKK